jgi:hypothetical protein
MKTTVRVMKHENFNVTKSSRAIICVNSEQNSDVFETVSASIVSEFQKPVVLAYLFTIMRNA